MKRPGFPHPFVPRDDFSAVRPWRDIFRQEPVGIGEPTGSHGPWAPEASIEWGSKSIQCCGQVFYPQAPRALPPIVGMDPARGKAAASAGVSIPLCITEPERVRNRGIAGHHPP